MEKIIWLLFVICLFLLRALILKLQNKNPAYLWVSFFIVTIPLQFEKALTEYSVDEVSGTLGGYFALTTTVVLILAMLPFVNYTRLAKLIKPNSTVLVILALITFSYINPLNKYPAGTIIAALFIFSHLLLFCLFETKLDFKKVLSGIFDGLLLLSGAQLLLAICFPMLGILSATNLFHKGGEEWATRLGERDGAIGIFQHPGNLALFCIISASFFYASYLTKYKSKTSLILISINAIVLFLTYSRTSYIAFIIVLISIYICYKNANKSLLTISNVLKFGLPVVGLILWVIFFSPLSEQFLKSDTGTQIENRSIHYLMALSIFEKAPILGIGINAHITYLAQNFSIIQAFTTDNFFSTNPIHNIHLIILTEVGIMGFSLWLAFLLITIKDARREIARSNNLIFSLTAIGILVAIILYGMTGWAPFSKSILPYVLFVVYFMTRYKKYNQTI